MLIINQAILIPDIEANLLCPMQLRDNDIKVKDEPKSMLEHPTEWYHCIIVGDLKIALSLKGVVSYFPVSKPTKEEYESSSHENRIVLTYDSPVRDPHTTRFGKAEEAMLDYHGKYRSRKSRKQARYFLPFTLSQVMTCFTAILEN